MTTPPSPARLASASGERPCCTEFARLSRRGVLGGLIGVGATTVVGSAVVSTASVASAAAPGSASADSVMVVLSLRGAADGLSLVVPHSDPAYYAARRRIAIPAERLLRTDATFGLHPDLEALLPLWDRGELTTVHGTGLPAPNRSHFSAMEEIEDADPGSAKRQGWLNRLVGGLPGTSPLQGFSLGGGVIPTSLQGAVDVMAAPAVSEVAVAGADQWDDGSRTSSLRTLWKDDRGPLSVAMRAAFASVDDFAPAQSTKDNAGRYPDHDLGRAMSEVARIVRGDVGVGVITVDQGDWDMHANLGTLEWGRMRANARAFAESVAAFFTDLGDQRDKVTLVAFSEFGRRVAENANYGLDHGWGNVMFLAGRGVRGGYRGTLTPLQTTEDADVPVTTDYRSVLSEVVTSRFDVSRAEVFPGFSPEPVGVMTSL